MQMHKITSRTFGSSFACFLPKTHDARDLLGRGGWKFLAKKVKEKHSRIVFPAAVSYIYS